MSNHTPESGWQRFLDRLKQLWGKPRDADLAATPARSGESPYGIIAHVSEVRRTHQPGDPMS